MNSLHSSATAVVQNLLDERKFQQAMDYASQVQNKSRRMLVLEDVARFFVANPIEEVVRKRSSFQGDVSPAEVERLIIGRITKRLPFSLVRLGDGEGNLLAFRNIAKMYPHASSQYAQLMLDVWFGTDRAFSREEFFSESFELLMHAVITSDVVGVPTARRLAQEHQRNYRGYFGTVSVIEFLKTFSTPNLRVGDCGLHLLLTERGFFQRLFEQVETCSVVTCHESLAARLEDRFMLRDVNSYLIPEQRNKSSLFGSVSSDIHFPDIFHRMRGALFPRFPGEVFLVAGGPLGKIYCSWVKDRGGVAIDIGSMADLWLGFHSRGSHVNSEKIAKYKILRG